MKPPLRRSPATLAARAGQGIGRTAGSATRRVPREGISGGHTEHPCRVLGAAGGGGPAGPLPTWPAVGGQPRAAAPRQHLPGDMEGGSRGSEPRGLRGTKPGGRRGPPALPPLLLSLPSAPLPAVPALPPPAPHPRQGPAVPQPLPRPLGSPYLFGRKHPPRSRGQRLPPPPLRWDSWLGETRRRARRLVISSELGRRRRAGRERGKKEGGRRGGRRRGMEARLAASPAERRPAHPSRGACGAAAPGLGWAARGGVLSPRRVSPRRRRRPPLSLRPSLRPLLFRPAPLRADNPARLGTAPTASPTGTSRACGVPRAAPAGGWCWVSSPGCSAALLVRIASLRRCHSAPRASSRGAGLSAGQVVGDREQ